MRRKLSIAMFIFGAFLTFVPFAFASASRPPVVLPSSENVSHNYFGVGSSVDVEGTVNGDAYLAGGTILVGGTVHGDVLAAGGQITIKGTVNNIRVVGGQVIIDGKVNGNVTIVGGSITLTNGSLVAGSVVGAGGQFLLSGPVGKTVNITAGQVTIENMIGGEAAINTNHLTLSSNAHINGPLWYESPQSVIKETGVVVTGKITHMYPPQKPTTPNFFAVFASIALVVSIIKLILQLIIGFIILGLLPVYSKRILDQMQQSPWISLGIGVLGWIIFPLIILILTFTLIGIPLAILGGIALVLLSYMGKIFAALLVGSWFLKYTQTKTMNFYWAFIIGIILLDILGFIPVLGWIFVAIMGAIGFGAVLILEKKYFVELRAKKIL